MTLHLVVTNPFIVYASLQHGCRLDLSRLARDSQNVSLQHGCHRDFSWLPRNVSLCVTLRASITVGVERAESLCGRERNYERVWNGRFMNRSLQGGAKARALTAAH